VRRRSAAIRRPLRRNRNRAESRSTVSAGVIERIRVAASSIASGSPSRRRQSSATARALPSVRTKSGVAAAAAFAELAPAI
jgi:hypothetical protein